MSRKGKVSPGTRQRLYSEAGSNCPLCGVEYLGPPPLRLGLVRNGVQYWTCDYPERYHHRKRTIDHIVPVAAGGNSRAANLRVICGGCNMRKGARYVL